MPEHGRTLGEERVHPLLLPVRVEHGCASSPPRSRAPLPRSSRSRSSWNMAEAMSWRPRRIPEARSAAFAAPKGHGPRFHIVDLEVAARAYTEFGVAREPHDDARPPRGGSPIFSQFSTRSSAAANPSSRPGPVTLKPGQRQLTATRVPSRRRANSFENMMSISFVFPYTRDEPRRQNGAVSCRSKAGTSPPLCLEAREATVTTRHGAEEARLSRRMFARSHGST